MSLVLIDLPRMQSRIEYTPHSFYATLPDRVIPRPHIHRASIILYILLYNSIHCLIKKSASTSGYASKDSVHTSRRDHNDTATPSHN